MSWNSLNSANSLLKLSGNELVHKQKQIGYWSSSFVASLQFWNRICESWISYYLFFFLGLLIVGNNDNLWINFLKSLFWNNSALRLKSGLLRFIDDVKFPDFSWLFCLFDGIGLSGSFDCGFPFLRKHLFLSFRFHFFLFLRWRIFLFRLHKTTDFFVSLLSLLFLILFISSSAQS